MYNKCVYTAGVNMAAESRAKGIFLTGYTKFLSTILYKDAHNHMTRKLILLMITTIRPGRGLIELVAFKGRICSDPKSITYYNYNFKLLLTFFIF